MIVGLLGPVPAQCGQRSLIGSPEVTTDMARRNKIEQSGIGASENQSQLEAASGTDAASRARSSAGLIATW